MIRCARGLVVLPQGRPATSFASPPSGASSVPRTASSSGQVRCPEPRTAPSPMPHRVPPSVNGRSLKVDLDGKTATVRTRARRMRMPTAPCRPNAPLRARAALHVVEQCANDRVRDAALHADGIVSVCTGEMFIVLAISVAALPRHRPHYHHHYQFRSLRCHTHLRGRFFLALPVGSPCTAIPQKVAGLPCRLLVTETPPANEGGTITLTAL